MRKLQNKNLGYDRNSVVWFDGSKITINEKKNAYQIMMSDRQQILTM
jgi:hypothetical protein